MLKVVPIDSPHLQLSNGTTFEPFASIFADFVSDDSANFCKSGPRTTWVVREWSAHLQLSDGSTLVSVAWIPIKLIYKLGCGKKIDSQSNFCYSNVTLTRVVPRDSPDSQHSNGTTFESLRWISRSVVFPSLMKEETRSVRFDQSDLSGVTKEEHLKCQAVIWSSRKWYHYNALCSRSLLVLLSCL